MFKIRIQEKKHGIPSSITYLLRWCHEQSWPIPVIVGSRGK